MRRPRRGWGDRGEDAVGLERRGRGTAGHHVLTPVPAQPGRPHDELARVARDEGTRVLATLTRIVGDLQLAEDCLQDAVVRALETWPRDGVPANPRGWLLV